MAVKMAALMAESKDVRKVDLRAEARAEKMAVVRAERKDKKRVETKVVVRVEKKDEKRVENTGARWVVVKAGPKDGS